MRQRVGLGFDVHRLEAGRPCILGGIELPFEAGCKGHSDGDAVLHAISDALLGAAGLDDLGTLFPDTVEEWKGADSAKLLSEVVERVHEAGWRVSNVDVVIATEGPRIAPHRDAMRERIASLLEIGKSATNVKGKTFEGLGALAKGEGVAVQAICLMREVCTRNEPGFGGLRLPEADTPLLRPADTGDTDGWFTLLTASGT